MKPESHHATNARRPSAEGSTEWPYSGSGSQPWAAPGGVPRSAQTPQSETASGADGSVMSISRKSPRPARSRRPLGESSSAYSEVGTLA